MRLAFSGIIVLLIAILAGEFFYFRHYIKRFYAYWNIDGTKKKNIIIKYLVVVAILVMTCFFFNIIGMATLHIVIAVMLTDLICFIIGKIIRKRPRILDFFAVSAIPGVVIGAAVVAYGIFNMSNIIRTEYNITTEKQLGETYKVAYVSDIHFGNSIDEEKLIELCEKIESENADMLLLVGDITDQNTDKSEYDFIYSHLGSVKTKYGTYFAFGNHDKIKREQIEKHGITVLEDETIDIGDDIILVGHKDASFKDKSTRMTMNDLLKDVDKSKFILLMDHQPSEYDKDREAGVDLQISGHTHAGQIFPAGYLTATIGGSEMNYGYYEKDGFKAIVSSGASGWGFPMRTEKNSEYVIINISD